MVLIPFSLNAAWINKYLIQIAGYGSCDFDGKTVYIEPLNSDTRPDDLAFRSYSNLLMEALVMKGAIPSYIREETDLIVQVRYHISDGQLVASDASAYGSQIDIDYTTVYQRSIDVVVVDQNTDNIVWNGRITTGGTSNDLRGIVGVALYKTYPYFGKDRYKSIKYIEVASKSLERFQNLDYYNTNMKAFNSRETSNGVLSICFVEFNNSKTSVVLSAPYGSEFVIGKNLELQYNGKSLKCVDTKEFSLGKKTKSKDEPYSYYLIYFPPVIGQTDEITITDGNLRWVIPMNEMN